MKPELRRRRTKMVSHLAMGNSLDATVDALSVEFNASKAALYADYERMETWVHDIQADELLCSKLKQRLEFLNRTAIDMLLDLNSSGDGKRRQLSVKEQFVKIGVINAILRVTQEQIKLGQGLGLIERKPEELIIRNLKDFDTLIEFSREGDDSKEVKPEEEQSEDEEQ